jgi:hypothetical protein
MRTPLSLSSVSALLAAASLTLAAAGCGDTETKKSPVHDIPGVTLLDTGDDGNNTPLEDDEAPAGFSSYGFWYTYDDKTSCMGTEDPNLDMLTDLVPPQGSNLTTTPYSALQISPPPEQLPNAPDNTHGIRFSGGDQEYFGAGLGFKLENAYAASNNQGVDFTVKGKYSGFRFWAYSSTGTSYIFKTQDLYSTPESLQCTPRGPHPECLGPQNCENAPSITFPLAANVWSYVEVYFKAPPTPVVEGTQQVQGPLVRANWDGVDNSTPPRDIKTLPAEPTHVFQLQFQTSAPPGPGGKFDLIIDNFGFIEAGSAADKTAGVP